MSTRRSLGVLALLGLMLLPTAALADEAPPGEPPPSTADEGEEPAPETLKPGEQPTDKSKRLKKSDLEKKDPPAEKAPEPAKPEEKAPAGEDDEDDDLESLIEQASQDSRLGGWADKLAEKTPSYPYIEHHGYFRFRADLFLNGHLGTVVPGDDKSGTSAVPAPLTENQVNNDDSGAFFDQVNSEDAATIAGANIRFRYQPTIHIARSMRIHATFDVLDNLFLGSTPDFAGNLSRPDVPLAAFTGSQAPPSAGVNSVSDSIRVKEAYGEWQPAFLLRVGRMASHWGLGILANGGNGIDDDFGDYADRAMLALKLYGVYVVVAWDYLYSGALNDDPGVFFGQAKDLGQADDVNQWVVSFFQRPLSDAEKEKRKVDMYEHFKPMFDWGVYGVIRTQRLDLSTGSYDDWQRSGGAKNYDFLELVPRDAFAVIPDLWLRFQKRFDYFSGIRVELEAAMIYGNVDNVTDDATVDTPSRDIFQWGAALEIEYDVNELSTGLDVGVASGDSAEGFGVDDRPTLSEPDGSPNSEVSAFKFDRNYHVDLLLFREVIGTVTNAVYIKPWIAYDLFDNVEEALGARLDLMYAQALEAEATPGNESFYGFEADLRLFYHEKNRFAFDVEMGLLIPGGAFNYRPEGREEDNRDAGIAFSLQSRLTLQF